MQHCGLENGRWAEMSFMEQMANVGSEVSRTLKWMRKNNADQSRKAFDRALELIDLTIRFGRLDQDGRPAMLGELCRFREKFCEAFLDGDIDEVAAHDRYMMHFAVAFQNKKRMC